MFFLSMLCSLLLVFGAFVWGEGPVTVAELDLSKYQGKWFEIAANMFTQSDSRLLKCFGM